MAIGPCSCRGGRPDARAGHSGTHRDHGHGPGLAGGPGATATAYDTPATARTSNTGTAIARTSDSAPVTARTSDSAPVTAGTHATAALATFGIASFVMSVIVIEFFKGTRARARIEIGIRRKYALPGRHRRKRRLHAQSW